MRSKLFGDFLSPKDSFYKVSDKNVTLYKTTLTILSVSANSNSHQIGHTVLLVTSIFPANLQIQLLYSNFLSLNKLFSQFSDTKIKNWHQTAAIYTFNVRK